MTSSKSRTCAVPRQYENLNAELPIKPMYRRIESALLIAKFTSPRNTTINEKQNSFYNSIESELTLTSNCNISIVVLIEASLKYFFYAEKQHLDYSGMEAFE